MKPSDLREINRLPELFATCREAMDAKLRLEDALSRML